MSFISEFWFTISVDISDYWFRCGYVPFALNTYRVFQLISLENHNEKEAINRDFKCTYCSNNNGNANDYQSSLNEVFAMKDMTAWFC